MKRNIFIILLILYSLAGSAQKYRGEFAKIEFGLSASRMNFFVDMFETKKQLLDFMDIKKGDVIAEVGAANGWNLGVLSTVYDSVTFYAEDINTKDLNQRSFDRTISYYKKKRTTKQTNNFKWVIGTLTTTNLPQGTFDKILLIDAFHDFNKKDDMIEDVAKKLKPGGKIYILDGFSFPGDTQTCPDAGPHVLTMLPVEIKRFEEHGFYPTKITRPDRNGAHYGNGVVFERNKELSEEFYKLKNAIDPLISLSAGFAKPEIAGDSVKMKEITQAISPKIREVENVYKEYEVWVKDCGVRFLRKMNYKSATNIFKANVKFFPDSYQAWYWLGVACQENKQSKEAELCFKRSLELNKANSNAAERLKQLK